jgi:alpha-galactosidase
LYNVFERTLEKYPSVWIEGCASGGRMIDVRLHPEHFSLILIFACSRSK